MPCAFPKLALLAAACLCSTAVCADGRISVVFNDPGASFASYYDAITTHTVAAGDAWLAHFDSPGFDAELTVSIGFAGIATANGRSATSAWLGLGANGVHLYEQGAAHELLTGIDGNGAAADIEINFGINGYLQNELWFDPDPSLRLAVVPAGRTDAMSVLLHEFGHAFAFNGWRDGQSGALPGLYQSTFDALVQPAHGLAGGPLWLNAPHAAALYGGPLALTLGNYAHLGNGGTLAGNDLVADLMNGVVFYRGTRYAISPLDLALMQDMGLPVLAGVPEPGAGGLALSGLAALLLLGLWKRQRP